MKKADKFFSTAKYIIILLVLVVLSVSIVGSSSSSYITTATQYGEVSSVTPYVLSNEIRISFYSSGSSANKSNYIDCIYGESKYNSTDYAVRLENASNVKDNYGEDVTENNIDNFVEFFGRTKEKGAYGTLTSKVNTYDSNNNYVSYPDPLVTELDELDKDAGSGSGRTTTLNIAPFTKEVSMTVYYKLDNAADEPFYLNGTVISSANGTVSSINDSAVNKTYTVDSSYDYTSSSNSGRVGKGFYKYQTEISAEESTRITTSKDNNTMIFLIVFTPIEPNISVVDSSGNTSGTINTDDTTNLTTSYNYFDSTGYSLSYESGNTDVATVDNSGVITGVAGGTATITVTATSSGNPTYTATYTITVNDVVGIVDSGGNTSGTILTSGEITLSASINGLSGSVSWSSSDDGIATVDSSGKVTGVSKGTATITATYTNNLGTETTATYVIEVLKPEIVIAEEYVSLGSSGSTTVSISYSDLTYDSATVTAAVTDSSGNTASNVSAEVSEQYLTITTTSATAGIYKVTVTDSTTSATDSIIVIVGTESTASGQFTASYTADAYAANSTTYKGTDSGSCVTITPTSDVISAGIKSQEKSTSDNMVTYTNYLQVNISKRSFAIDVSGAITASITVYFSHTSKASRTLYISTTAYSTDATAIKASAAIGSTSSSPSNLEVLTANNLESGTYYVYGSDTLHVYAIVVEYTASTTTIDDSSVTTAASTTVGATTTISLASGDTIMSLDTSIATISDTGTITGVAEGTTYILVESSSGALTLYKVTVGAASG